MTVGPGSMKPFEQYSSGLEIGNKSKKFSKSPHHFFCIISSYSFPLTICFMMRKRPCLKMQTFIQDTKVLTLNLLSAYF